MKDNESQTWLNKGTVCQKGDQAIAFRGEIDSLYAECIVACAVAKNAKNAKSEDAEQNICESKGAKNIEIAKGTHKQDLKKFLHSHYTDTQTNVSKIMMEFCQTQAGKIAFNDVGLEQIKVDIEQCLKLYDVITTPDSMAEMFKEAGL